MACGEGSKAVCLYFRRTITQKRIEDVAKFGNVMRLPGLSNNLVLSRRAIIESGWTCAELLMHTRIHLTAMIDARRIQLS